MKIARFMGTEILAPRNDESVELVAVAFLFDEDAAIYV